MVHISGKLKNRIEDFEIDDDVLNDIMREVDTDKARLSLPAF